VQRTPLPRGSAIEKTLPHVLWMPSELLLRTQSTLTCLPSMAYGLPHPPSAPPTRSLLSASDLVIPYRLLTPSGRPRNRFFESFFQSAAFLFPFSLPFNSKCLPLFPPRLLRSDKLLLRRPRWSWLSRDLSSSEANYQISPKERGPAFPFSS